MSEAGSTKEAWATSDEFSDSRGKLFNNNNNNGERCQIFTSRK